MDINQHKCKKYKQVSLHYNKEVVVQELNPIPLLNHTANLQALKML